MRTFARVAPEAVARAKEDVQEALTAAHAAGSPLKEASATIASQTKRLAANEDTIERLQAQLAKASKERRLRKRCEVPCSCYS